MIFNIRGTAGSGKSYVVHQVMGSFPRRTPLMVRGRRQPLGYLCESATSRLFVPGHYEAVCGGCDTIPNADAVYQLIGDAIDAFECDVIYEGLMVSGESKRLGVLNRMNPEQVAVILLTTPLSSCLDNLRNRREVAHQYKLVRHKRRHAGKETVPDLPKRVPLKTELVERKFNHIENTMRKLAGEIVVHRKTSTDAVGWLRRYFGV